MGEGRCQGPSPSQRSGGSAKTGGYTGKILRVNLTNTSIRTMPTEKYEGYGGGHGMGSAIFFDLVGEQLPFESFDPRNLLIVMAHPFAGAFMPGSGRGEVQGMGPMLYPIEWFAHSNFGGRFASQLKHAGCFSWGRTGVKADLLIACDNIEPIISH